MKIILSTANVLSIWEAKPVPHFPALRKKPILFSLLILVLLVSSAIILFHGYIAYQLLHPHVDPITSNPMLAKNLAYEDIRFFSKNHQTLANGWYIPAKGSEQTVIFSHGYGANREETWVPMYDLAEKLHLQDYNVVMFDYGFASSDHKAVTGGKQESQELLGAIDVAKRRGAKEIYIWGFSMGAGTALQTALYSKDIDGMILDSTFILEPDTLYYNIKQYINLPRNPSLSLIRWSFPFLNGTSLSQIPYKEVKNKSYDMPIFMIHSTRDEKAPYQLAEAISHKQQVSSGDNFWLVDDSMHELIYRMHSDEYLRKTFSFLRGISDHHGKIELASAQ
jgi:predicted esterase